MKPTQALKDAAILVALVLLATSVRVTDLPKAPLGPETHAGAPASVQAAQAEPTSPVAVLPAGPCLPVTAGAALGELRECVRLQRLTVSGSSDERVVIEIDLDPGLRSALGVCPEPAAAPASSSEKA